MKEFSALLVSAIWGAVSTQLFLQAWLAAIGFVIAFIGFLIGRVKRSITSLGMGVALIHVFIFAGLLHTGSWLITDILNFGWSRIENIVYWIFAALSAVCLFPQIPYKLRKTWRNAMVPGSIEEDIMKRQLGLDPNIS